MSNPVVGKYDLLHNEILSLSVSHLVQSCGNPHGFETLCLKSFNVAVWIRTLEEPGNVQIGINESYFCFLFG